MDLLRFEAQNIRTLHRVRNELLDGFEERGYDVQDGEVHEQELVDDGGHDEWPITYPVGNDELLPLDMANNIEDQRVRERITWVDGLGRAYADALTDSELVADGGVPQSFQDLAATCETCGEDVDPQRLEDGECPGCAYGEPVTDGGTAWTDLHAFQRDCLEATHRLEEGGETTYGLAIKRELERLYGEEVLHGRLYPNLDELVVAGLIEKGDLDKQTNEYALTNAAESMLEQRARLLADACGLEQPVADGGDR